MKNRKNAYQVVNRLVRERYLRLDSATTEHKREYYIQQIITLEKWAAMCK